MQRNEFICNRDGRNLFLTDKATIYDIVITVSRILSAAASDHRVMYLGNSVVVDH